MYIYLVTENKLREKAVGYYRGLFCYLMPFYKYQKGSERGHIFTTAKQALKFMLKRFYK